MNVTRDHASGLMIEVSHRIVIINQFKRYFK
jgi:hypothetical protein